MKFFQEFVENCAALDDESVENIENLSPLLSIVEERDFMKNAAEKSPTIYLNDYKKPDYLIEKVHLTFDLDDTKTQVKSVLQVVKNHEGDNYLVLTGEEMKLLSVSVDGTLLQESEYRVTDDELTIFKTSDSFELVIENEINPKENKSLEGLYKSGEIFCTQNEAEGFRKITYFLDRSDVMAIYTTKIIADKEQFPILLSNGNPMAKGDLDNGRHFVEWLDPFPKPSYLYALVAGDLALVKDTYKTISGKEVALEIYVDKGNEGKCDHAMESLKNSMKWDEEVYGLEYDLDIYMIVAVDSFNMGAMENKGLNIFNSSYVLASRETATDNDFLGVEGVIGHEYFHNWTGNRITCRDWFQLTLKEGLTVFRDQEFSGDMNSKTVQRISDVQSLRSHQFSEDAGPMAHPIRPESYIKIDNFYTSTIYNKGAEVIRMIHTLLTPQGFRKGMDKYFELFDGQAVTTEDFIHAMSVANDNFDFSQFQRWYSQAATPKVTVEKSYDQTAKTFTIKVSQTTRPTAECQEKKPFYFPVSIGLLNGEGKDFDLVTDSENQKFLDRGLLIISKETEEFTFKNIDSNPVLSFNRNFTAPINVVMNESFEDQVFLMKNDSDQFNRYESSQKLAKRVINGILEGQDVSKEYLDAYLSILKDENIDDMLKSFCISVPSVSILKQNREIIDFNAIIKARKVLTDTISKEFENEFKEIFDLLNTKVEFKIDSKSIGRRSLKNNVLKYLAGAKEDNLKIAYEYFQNATNMTDEISSLSILCDSKNEYRDLALNEFYQKWKDVTLVMQKWLTVQGHSSAEDTYEKVQVLEKDPVYDKTVPNLFRSLILSFARNPKELYHESGRGFELVSNRIIELDKLNPQMAAGASRVFCDYKKLPDGLKGKMEQSLKKIIDVKDLSKNTYEVISTILN